MGGGVLEKEKSVEEQEEEDGKKWGKKWHKTKETVTRMKEHAPPRCEKCSQTPFWTSKKPQGLAKVL